jgi:photosystem II stability/assembly factor-like uncharacterized protein
MKRLLDVAVSALPFLIVLGLLYAAFFIKPSVDGSAAPPPAMARDDAVYGVSLSDGARVLWAAGSSGKIWQSRDAGASWTLQQTGVRQTLQDIAVWDRERAVAVGNDGVIVVTRNGGRSWAPVNAPRSAIANKLVRVRTYPGGEAWTVGEAGMALRSLDYGASWTRMAPEEDSGWNDVSKQGSQIILAGEFGRLRMSVDNGANWRDLDSGVKSSLMALAFKDGQEGAAVGLDGVVLSTSDGGQRWVRQPQVSHAHLFDVIWDGGRWAATGNQGVLLTGEPRSGNWRAAFSSPTDRRWHTRILALADHYLLAGQGVGLLPRPAP